MPVSAGTLRFEWAYNTNNGLAASVKCTNANVTVSNRFDVLDRPTNIAWTASATALANFGYVYNTAGMVTQKIAKVGSSMVTNRYTYDDLDRLVGETLTGAVTASATYAYDVAGNHTQRVLNGVTNTYTYSSGCNRLVSWGTNIESTASYNAAGCVTGLLYSATNKLYLTWNGQYQLTQVGTGGASVIERNGYDALGRRVWSWGADGTTTNYFLNDGAHVLADVNSTGGLRRVYAYGPGVHDILAMTVHTGTTVKTYYYLKDHLGSVLAVTDSTGTNIVERYVYDAWGRVQEVCNAAGTKLTQTAIGNRFLWQGREYSWKTGLYYFRARYYGPATGRWLSPDPIGISGGFNQYVFCANTPVNFRDPLGLLPGDPYATPDVATRAAMEQYTTRWQWLERGGSVYKYTDADGCTKYSYTEATKGSMFAADVGPTFSKVPASGTLVGFWHSHTFLGNLNQPSFSRYDYDQFNRFKQGMFWLHNNWSGQVDLLKKVTGEPDVYKRLGPSAK